ncbi:unnamed protein product, partial [Ixodes pacificus]
RCCDVTTNKAHSRPLRRRTFWVPLRPAGRLTRTGRPGLVTVGPEERVQRRRSGQDGTGDQGPRQVLHRCGRWATSSTIVLVGQSEVSFSRVVHILTTQFRHRHVDRLAVSIRECVTCALCLAEGKLAPPLSPAQL